MAGTNLFTTLSDMTSDLRERQEMGQSSDVEVRSNVLKEAGNELNDAIHTTNDTKETGDLYQNMKDDKAEEVSRDDEFEEALAEAKENGMGDEEIGMVKDSYARAGTDLAKPYDSAVKTSIVDNVKDANENFKTQGKSSYENLPAKSESLYRSGVKYDLTSRDGKASIKDYEQSISRSNEIAKKQDEKQVKKVSSKSVNEKITEKSAEKSGGSQGFWGQLSTSIGDLADKVSKSGKSVSVNFGNNTKMDVTPTKMQNGKSGADIAINGVKQTAGKAASTVLNAVPGGTAVNVAGKAVQKAGEIVKEQKAKTEDLQNNASR